MVNAAVCFAAVLAVATALPTQDPVILKLEPGLRFQYVPDAEGTLQLEDLWLKTSDVTGPGRYAPDAQNVYHLFTRLNPIVSQPMLMGNTGLIGLTNYNAERRTVILLHGRNTGVTDAHNNVLIPAFLQAEDVNIIAVDWSQGSNVLNYATAVQNTRLAGESIARFVNWLNSVTGATATHYHIVGHSLGGQMAGVVARNIDGVVAYVTSLDPAYPGFVTNDHKLRPRDAGFVEVIHTNAGIVGYIGTLGHMDFYPNGGVSMPGCNSPACDHDRSFHYLAESLVSGGFTGRRCATFPTAMAGTCFLPGSALMGGLVPKTGSSGIFHLETNAGPPFSRG